MAGHLARYRMREPKAAPTAYAVRSESQLASVLRGNPENIQRLFRYRIFGEEKLRNVLQQLATHDLDGLLHILNKDGSSLHDKQKVDEILNWPPPPFSLSRIDIADVDTAFDAIRQTIRMVPFETWVQRAIQCKSPAVKLFMEQYEAMSALLVFWKPRDPAGFESLREVSFCNPYTFSCTNGVKKLGKAPLQDDNWDVSFIHTPIAEFLRTHRNENLATILERLAVLEVRFNNWFSPANEFTMHDFCTDVRFFDQIQTAHQNTCLWEIARSMSIHHCDMFNHADIMRSEQRGSLSRLSDTLSRNVEECLKVCPELHSTIIYLGKVSLKRAH